MFSREFDGIPRGPGALKWAEDGTLAVMVDRGVVILRPQGKTHPHSVATLSAPSRLLALSQPTCRAYFTAPTASSDVRRLCYCLLAHARRARVLFIS